VKLLLNSIVRNEAARIVRMLASVAPHISGWSITDTGSTDDTRALIETFFQTMKLPGKLSTCEFKDFSQARNHALTAAQNSGLEFDYILLVDADMELKVLDPTWADGLTGPAHDMFQVSGALQYQNRRLVKKGEPHGYLGVTHEYLNVDTGGCIPMDKAYFFDHADGSNRVEKFKRDIILLKEGLKEEPKNERYLYYLAQSYRDAGKPEKAAKWYKRRVAAGGWDQEVWSAQYSYAQTLKDQGDLGGYLRESLVAYNMRPSRAEPLYDIAKYFREKGESVNCLIFAEAGMQIPKSPDALFVNDFVYACGCAEEFSISSYYVPQKRVAGYKVTNLLSLKPGPYAQSRELARDNMFHYAPPLKELCPSFDWKPIDFKAPEGWTCLNPSVARMHNKLACIVRTVNYRMDDQGRYLIGDTPPSDSNPINTRNWLVHLNADLTIRPAETIEILQPADRQEPLYKAVIGFEDMRLFRWRNNWWTSSTVRELNAAGFCEQTLARIDFSTSPHSLADVKRMIRTPQLYEKNWAPIVKEPELHFMYRPGHVVDAGAKDVIVHPPKLEIGHFSGGSQLVKTKSGWIYLVHEARIKPQQGVRFYLHRFVTLKENFEVDKITPPFCFRDKEIEFAAGMCLHPDEKRYVISFGYRDREACIGTVDLSDVERLLCAS
jgi:glycosyltransferase involved in cell wall biosynthesis